MKLLFAAALATLPLALAGGAPERPAPPEDPPIECPLCGGNVRLHALIVGALSATNAEAGRRVLVGLLG